MEPLLTARVVGSLALVASGLVGVGEVGLRSSGHFDARTTVSDDVTISQRTAASLEGSASAPAPATVDIHGGAAASTGVQASAQVPEVAAVGASVDGTGRDNSTVKVETHTTSNASAAASAAARTSGALSSDESASSVDASGAVTADVQAGVTLTPDTPPLPTSLSASTAANTGVTLSLQGR